MCDYSYAQGLEDRPRRNTEVAMLRRLTQVCENIANVDDLRHKLFNDLI